MNKIAIAASVLSACGVAAAGYYVSPASGSASDVEPILVAASIEELTPQLSNMRILRFVRQFGGDKAERELRSMGDSIIWETMSNEGDGNFVLKAKFFDDNALIITARAEPAGTGQTAVDIDVEIPDNRFITSDKLHPNDRNVLAAMVEVVATEYVSSVLNRQKMASGRELEPLMLHAAGVSEDDMKAMGDRMEAAFEDAYKDDLSRIAGGRGGPSGSAWDRQLRDRASNGGFEPERIKNERRAGW